MKTSFAAIACLAATLVAGTASAQQYKLGAYAGLSSGVEGGSNGSFGLRRARTMLRLGGDARVDEFPSEIIGIYGVAEIEPHASVGLEGRYMHMLGESNVVHIGGIGLLAPSTLFGANAGFAHRFNFSKSIGLEAGPVFQVYFIGSDLPDNEVVWQGLLQVGIHANL